MTTLRFQVGEQQKLVKVRLSDVDLDTRKLAAQTVRERDWRTFLRDTQDPGLHLGKRANVQALWDAVDVEAAALFPKGLYVISESAAETVLGENHV